MLCDYVRQIFSEAFMSSFAGHGDESRVPVFVVGMPRSGSTLVEQILASHPGVLGAGEIPDFDRVTHMRWPYGGPPTADGSRPAAPPEPKQRYFAERARASLCRAPARARRHGRPDRQQDARQLRPCRHDRALPAQRRDRTL
ncbi:hypothetical protein C7I85_24810 [Mesorhizobium soli]|uniref:Sulfotransferase n=1 Tax=Pseudaminobacter soli (ex Li et al. 2025) TaxID=1295366 RepID=A0A2P7S1F4_9HYPH|nr:hypothetical protein C7I85_24810 [Mesorhizobium soli]